MGKEEPREQISRRMLLSLSKSYYGFESERAEIGHTGIGGSGIRSLASRCSKMSPKLASNGRHVMQLWAHRRVREQRSRIRSVTVSSRLCIDFFKGTVHVKSRFAFSTDLNTCHQRLSLRLVVRCPSQPAPVADADDELTTI